ncbi:MAG: hypothetical protein ACI4UX_02755 [Clostridia bacterium]
MNNLKIKGYFNKMSENSKNIIISIIEDSLVYLDNQNFIDNNTLNRIVSIYFLLTNFEYKEMIEFEDLNSNEKKLIYRIILNGIASIYVDNDYLEYSDIGTKYKKRIIQELLSFLKFISKLSEEKVFRLYEIEVKKYRKKGLNWDNISY